MIDADREALRERLALFALDGGDEWALALDVADELLATNDLLVVDLRCPTCGGGDFLLVSDCPTCHGSGRRDVRVVDAGLLRRYVVATTTDDSDAFTADEWAQIEGWTK